MRNSNINKTIIDTAKATQLENVKLKALLKETVRLFGGEYGKGKKYDDCLGGRHIEKIKEQLN